MAQLTIRADDALVERIKQQAREQGRSMNQFAVNVLTAATDPNNEDAEIARIRAKLAAAGLLATPTPQHRERPPADLLAEARAAAGRGTPLSDLVSMDRG